MIKEQKTSNGTQAQEFAVSIEHTMRQVFKCERFGFGGLVDSDEIRKHPFLSMTQGLAYMYAINVEKREMIERFIEAFFRYSDFSLDDFLSFDSNEKTEGITTIELEKENGFEQVRYMIDEFRKVIE